MAKRTPSTSVEGQIAAMANAMLPPLEPPGHMTLRDGDRPYWDCIIAARARDEWTGVDLVVAVQLARCQADIERAQSRMDDEGLTAETKRGVPVMNPVVSVLEMLCRREMAIMRTLRMGGRVLGPPDINGMRRKVERDARSAAAEVEGEELLA